MAVGSGAEIVHGDGRKCKFDANRMVWLTWDHEDDIEVACNRKHLREEYGCDPTFGMPVFRGADLVEMMNIKAAANVRWFGTELLDSPRVPATPEAKYIVEHVMRQWLDLFLEKNAKYASVNKSARLGPAGHVPDINRKNGILLDRLWYNNPTVGEGTKEVVFDMIGHLMLLVADMEMEEEKDGSV